MGKFYFIFHLVLRVLLETQQIDRNNIDKEESIKQEDRKINREEIQILNG